MASETFEPRNRPYDVNRYQITMRFDPRAAGDGFGAAVRTRLTLTEAVSSVEFDAEELQILSIEMVKPKRQTLEFKMGKDTVTISLPTGLKKAAVVELDITYSGKIRSAHSGFFKVTDPDDYGRGDLFFTHFEAMGARAFVPCNDEPYDKAESSFEVLVPKGYSVISNGSLKGVDSVREGKESWQRFNWGMKRQHSTYLMSLAIGKFEKVTDGKRKMPEVSVWIGKTRKGRATYVADATRKGIDFFEGYLGVKYPWEKYATVGLPTYLWGGMENTSATHMNEERTVLNDPNSSIEKRRVVSLAAHELAHQWFGDLVTMKWWDDLWLNEAFASYFGTLATQHILDSEEELVAVVTDTWNDYFREEDGPRSHPIVDKTLKSADDAFDATNYTKGEAVLRMLSAYVGEEKFKKAVSNYLKKFSFGNATYLDFFEAVQAASGVDVSDFRDSWLLQKGYPVLTYSGEWNKAQKKYVLKVAQAANHGEKGSRPFIFKLPVAFHRRSEPVYTKNSVLNVSRVEETLEVELEAEPEWVSVNTAALALGKLVQKKADEKALVLQAESDPDTLSRVWALYELARPLVEGNGLGAGAEAALLRSLQKDSNPYVRSALLHLFKRAKTRWLPAKLGAGIIDQVKEFTHHKFEDSALFQTDPNGWRLVRAQTLGALGKVKSEIVLPLAAKALADFNLPFDDLGEAAYAVASQGSSLSVAMLKTALERHGSRGYRAKFLIEFSFGSLEDPSAAAAISELSKTSGSDLMGRIGWAVKDNQILKNSKEWSQFVADFILTNTRFGDGVKARVFQTLDEVKVSAAKSALTRITTESKSERMKELAQKTLAKNF
ncbi:MAG: hypothetical protein HYZ71_10000 [Deltaproteobacteria bacterium]|nr:hypothetical protein [Deltaproteobacteria bacterium]